MAVNKRNLNNNGTETGWPFINYAQEARGFQTAGGQQSVPISIPRFKYTWLAEFQINPRVFENPSTNLEEFLKDGKIYTQLLSIDHPSPKIKTEKIRSYNKWITVPTQVEYDIATMTFHDDSTSVTSALWKEHLNFYTHQASIGDTISGIGANANLGSQSESNSYQFGNALVGGDVRAKMDERPSLGMRLKANDMRHFFDAIVLYDLGTEPDGINVYWYHHPMINAWNHENLDKEDRTGNVRISASFDYEGYYFAIGQNRDNLSGYIKTILGDSFAGSSVVKNGIARGGRETNRNRKVELSSPDSLTADPRFEEGIGDELPDDVAFSDPSGLSSQLAKEKQAMLDAGFIDEIGDELPFGVEIEVPIVNDFFGDDFAGGEFFLDEIGDEFLQEPLSPKQLGSGIPLSLASKGRDLLQVRGQAEKLLGQFGGNIANMPAKVQGILGELQGRELNLVKTIQRQASRVQDKITNTVSENTSSLNTKLFKIGGNILGGQLPSLPQIPNPLNGANGIVREVLGRDVISTARKSAQVASLARTLNLNTLLDTNNSQLETAIKTTGGNLASAVVKKLIDERKTLSNAKTLESKILNKLTDLL
jgi:hypothetical protein